MSLRRSALPTLSTLMLASTLVVAGASAQQPQQPAPPAGGPAVGAQAPDFTAPGATRYGLLRDPVHLADFRGRTVILAFFPKARTKG